VIPILTESLLGKKKIIITNPDVTRFIMRTQDAVELICKSLDVLVGGEIFVLKMSSFKLGDLADVMVNFVAPHLGIEPKEVQIKTIGLVRGEKMHESLFTKSELDKMVVLDDFYAILDPETFPKHEKYSAYPKATNIGISSDQVPKVSSPELKDIVFECLAGISV
jgi:FlaA1/EpsC-like NDP-sugar epimerase